MCVCEGSSHPVAGQSIDKKAERASTKEKKRTWIKLSNASGRISCACQHVCASECVYVCACVGNRKLLKLDKDNNNSNNNNRS